MAIATSATVMVRVELELTHFAPKGGAVTPCCGHTPFELKRTDRLTNDAALVTCPGVWAARVVSGG